MRGTYLWVKTIKNRSEGAEGAQRIPGCLVGNLQLSNKSLRLRYYWDWLQQGHMTRPPWTWTLYCCLSCYHMLTHSRTADRQHKILCFLSWFFSSILRVQATLSLFIWLALPTPSPCLPFIRFPPPPPFTAVRRLSLPLCHSYYEVGLKVGL